MVRQEGNDGIQRSISYIKDDFQNPIEKYFTGKKKKGEIILVAW